MKVTRGHDKKRSDSAVSMLPRGLTQRYQWHRRESDSRGPLHGTNLLKNTENILAPCCHWYSKVWLIRINDTEESDSTVSMSLQSFRHMWLSRHMWISLHMWLSRHMWISRHMCISRHMWISRNMLNISAKSKLYTKRLVFAKIIVLSFKNIYTWLWYTSRSQTFLIS